MQWNPMVTLCTFRSTGKFGSNYTESHPIATDRDRLLRDQVYWITELVQHLKCQEGSVNHSTVVGKSSVKEVLQAMAYQVADNAYAPYSRFRVGAALRSSSGSYYSSCNIENSSYGLSMCAERNAVASAVATEGKAIRITDIVAVTPDGDNCSPCGACRQVLAELAPSANIWFLKNRNLVCRDINHLLPDRFNQSDSNMIDQSGPRDADGGNRTEWL